MLHTRQADFILASVYPSIPVARPKAPPITITSRCQPWGWKAAEVSENGMTCETPYIFEAPPARWGWRDAGPEFVDVQPLGTKWDLTDSSTNEWSVDIFKYLKHVWEVVIFFLGWERNCLPIHSLSELMVIFCFAFVCECMWGGDLPDFWTIKSYNSQDNWQGSNEELRYTYTSKFQDSQILSNICNILQHNFISITALDLSLITVIRYSSDICGPTFIGYFEMLLEQLYVGPLKWYSLPVYKRQRIRKNSTWCFREKNHPLLTCLIILWRISEDELLGNFSHSTPG